MILKISLDLPEDHAYLRMTRELGRTILRTIQAVDSDIDDTDTLIGELYANVLRHGQSEEGRFQVSLEYYADKLVLYVIDKGKGFSFKDVPEPGSTRPDFDGSERIGGYGLELIKALSDRLEFYRYDHSGTTVRAEKILHYKSEAAAEEAERLDESQSSSSIAIGQSKESS